MTYKTVYWDSVEGRQIERDCTPDEAAEIELRKLPQPTQVPQTVTVHQARLALAAIGLTDAQIDAIFVTAATL